MPGPDLRRVTVVADDGVPLSVRVHGPVDALVTVVLVHGHCLDTGSWSAVRERLAGQAGAGIRIVAYDQRGHGRSGVGAPETYTIDQLAHDLDVVLRTVVPHGPVVLAGHSMGGMVAMAYARLYPERIGSRVVGAALVATAASGLAELGLGRYLRHPAVSVLHRAVRRAPRVMQGSMRVGGRMCAPVVRRGGADSWARSLATTLAAEASIVTLSRFLAAFAVLDESAALAVLAAIPVLVLGGSADELTPFAHSRAIAARLPAAELVRVEGAGHSVIVQHADEVAAALLRLLTHVRGVAAPVAVV